LTDDDVIAEAERKVGKREDEPDSPLTPDHCDNCGEPVPMDNAKACPRCGIAFTPDAAQTQDKIEEDTYESKGEAEGEEEDALDQMKQLLKENPELINELTD
jgi:predicted amidophosphoribosyltransferase